MSLPERSLSSSSWPIVSLNWMLCFLLISVPLIPYRYLAISELPSVVSVFVRYFPAVISLSAGLLWVFFWKKNIVCQFKQFPLYFAVLALFAAGLISSLGADQPGVSVAREIYYFLTGGMLFLIVVAACSQKQAEFLMSLFLFTGYFIACYGLVEFWLGRSPIFGHVFNVENELYLRLSPDPWFGKRIISSIGHPIFLGVLLVMLLPLSMSYMFQAKTRLIQIGFAAGTLLLSVALLLTFSRGAWIAGVVAVAIYVKQRGVLSVRYMLSVSLILICSAILLLKFSESGDIFEERIREAYEKYLLDFESTSRGKSLGQVVEIMERYPLLGVGTGMHRFKAYVLGRSVSWPPTLDTPDNMYLLWISEHGVLGLFTAILFFAQLFLFLSHRASVDEDKRELLLALQASTIGFCVDMLTCSALHFPVTRITFWILAGLAVVYGRSQVTNPPRPC